jgi:hypothetical protein
MIFCDVILLPGPFSNENKLSIFLPVYNFINQQDAATSQVYYLSFKYSSTCFGHPHAHHQELQQLQQQQWPLVYRRSLVIVLLVVVGPAGPRATALLSPSSDGKSEVAAAVVAPDDGHEGARNMMSCIQTTSL